MKPKPSGHMYRNTNLFKKKSMYTQIDHRCEFSFVALKIPECAEKGSDQALAGGTGAVGPNALHSILQHMATLSTATSPAGMIFDDDANL